MQMIPIADPTWETTLPHRIDPRAGEWLAGVVLRCDEVNGWDSGTTAVALLRATHVDTDFKKLELVLPPSIHFLPLLAEWLAVPESALLATTFRAELAGLYAQRPALSVQMLGQSRGLQFCPACVAESRLLRRMFALPHMTCCPVHRVQLRSTCTCHEGKPPPTSDIPGLDPLLKLLQAAGVFQRLFAPGKPPFTCRYCGADWSNFPQLPADPQRLTLEQQMMVWYDFFFAQSTPAALHGAFYLIEQTFQQRGTKSIKRLNGTNQLVTLTSPEKTPLGRLVDVLVRLDLNPTDVALDESLLPWHPLTQGTFFCPIADCPHMQQLDIERGNVCDM